MALRALDDGKNNDRMYQLLQRPMRFLSLRTIVVVSELAVMLVAVLMEPGCGWASPARQYTQLDRRLDSVSSLGDLSTLLSTAQPNATTDAPLPGRQPGAHRRIAG